MNLVNSIKDRLEHFKKSAQTGVLFKNAPWLEDLMKINRNTMFLLNQLSSLMFHGLYTLANLPVSNKSSSKKLGIFLRQKIVKKIIENYQKLSYQI